MQIVSRQDYCDFLNRNECVRIGRFELRLAKQWKIERFEPTNYNLEETTVWSFPDRGNWATHLGNYPGNWSPFIPRNLLDRYTNIGDLVCDPMMGSGTTLVECKLMGRNAIGVDVDRNACMISMNRLDFQCKSL